MQCQKAACERKAQVRVFWPGREPSLQCIECSKKVLALAKAMGFYCHMELIENENSLEE